MFLIVHVGCFWAESFAMGKLHKDIAMAMVQLAEEESTTDQDIIKVSFRQRSACVAITIASKHSNGSVTM